MGRTGWVTAPGLKLQVDRLQPSYLPGDTLNGSITQQPKAIKDFSLRLKLVGRTESAIKRTNGQSSTLYKGHAILFEVLQRVYDGSLDDTEARTWTFSIQIPMMPFSSESRKEKQWDPEEGFRSTFDDGSLHPLPSTYYYRPETTGVKCEAFVEYFLLAEAIDHRRGITNQSTVPFVIRTPATAKPVRDFRPASRSFHSIVKSSNLIADVSDQYSKMHKPVRFSFRSSKPSQFAYTIHLDHPTVIQLDHPEPIPLRISMQPDLASDNSSIHSNSTASSTTSTPQVCLTSVSLRLRATTRLRCHNLFSTTQESKDREYDFNPQRKFTQQTIPIVHRTQNDDIRLRHRFSAATDPIHYKGAPLRPASDQRTPKPLLRSNHLQSQAHSRIRSDPIPASYADNRDLHHTPPTTIPPSSDSPTPPPQQRSLDLSTLLSFRLHHTGTSSHGIFTKFSSDLPLPLSPTFQTYNIAVSYTLEYKLGISCADKTEIHRGQTPVTVLGPSEDVVALQMFNFGV